MRWKFWGRPKVDHHLVPGDILNLHLPSEGMPLIENGQNRYFVDGESALFLMISPEEAEAISKGLQEERGINAEEMPDGCYKGLAGDHWHGKTPPTS